MPSNGCQAWLTASIADRPSRYRWWKGKDLDAIKWVMPSKGQRQELDALCIWQRANEWGLHEQREVTRPTPAHRANADERDEMLSAP